MKRKKQKAVNPIPDEARILGSILSEALPLKGENKAITTGLVIRINPAVLASSPFMNWRYKLNKNPAEYEAL